MLPNVSSYLKDLGIMNFTSTLKNVLESVGKNNKPTYTVMAVAAANGIFKPISQIKKKNLKQENMRH